MRWRSKNHRIPRSRKTTTRSLGDRGRHVHYELFDDGTLVHGIVDALLSFFVVDVARLYMADNDSSKVLHDIGRHDVSGNGRSSSMINKSSSGLHLAPSCGLP